MGASAPTEPPKPTVADVVPDDVPDDEETQEHTHAGQEQVQPVRSPDQTLEPMMDGADGHLQQDGRQAAQHAGHDRQDGNLAPDRQGMQKGPQRAPDVFDNLVPYWAMLSSGRVSPAASEASALPPATASFSASSSPSSQRSTSSRSSVFTLIFTR